ncbi:MAG TPA: carboxypeptidase regulatory-like domain-containing protein [Terriglobales bacterium]|nr:carboxypeptidase regulatory-like domain-containing protein [Terriglobales bacterium]
MKSTELRRRNCPAISAILLVLFWLPASPVSAQSTLTGTLINRTTNQPAAGDDVILLSLSQGMQESDRAKSDAMGHFTLKLDDAATPHLVRAIHQGVTYHHMAPPGTTSVQVEVYDVLKKVVGLSVAADMMRLQVRSNQLEGIRLFAVDNKSSPPRTQMSDQNFEFYLPEGAEVVQGLATTAGGQPVNSAPVPQKEKDRYAFLFPLRPGQTVFQVAFRLPYSGQVTIRPKELYGTQHFVVMLPKTMQFAGAPGTTFHLVEEPQEPDTAVEVASKTSAGQMLDFTISGAGVLSDSGAGQDSGQTAAAAPSRDSRPGGGIGPPIDAPDPLEKYRWYILGGFALVLTGGAFYIVGGSKARATAGWGPAKIDRPESSRAQKPKPAGQPALLMDALKEEIFQLELEHKQGRISQQEYEKAKAALDQTLERAVRRTTTKTT